MRSGKRRHQRQAGFVYLLLLTALAVVGAASATAVGMGALMTRRNAEEELLAIGAEYERALASYRMATPPGLFSREPKSFDDLLKDPRVPSVKRHLRRVYSDPLTGTKAWGLVRSGKGTIIGIYSLAEDVPIKRTGFEGKKLYFENASTYRDWVFGEHILRSTFPAPQ